MDSQSRFYRGPFRHPQAAHIAWNLQHCDTVAMADSSAMRDHPLRTTLDEYVNKLIANYMKEVNQMLEQVKKMSESKHQYKLVILYDNGKKFTVKGVTQHSFKYKSQDSDQKVALVYSCYNSKSKVSSDFRVPAVDIAAITVKKPNSVYTERFKSCAVISGGAEKRENNHQQLQQVNVTNVKTTKSQTGVQTDTEAASKPAKARSGIFKRQSGASEPKLQRSTRSG